MGEVLLNVSEFSLHTKKDHTGLIDHIGFSLNKGEILGIVGESGCGKSVTALSVMRLHAPGAFSMSGEIVFEGKNLLAASEKDLIGIRGNEISMIFQDPMISLNPVHTVEAQITEIILLHQAVTKEEARRMALEQLKLVAIAAPEDIIRRYPHELSGGMRQRVMIAMAMANRPKLLIADEPTTALDVTVQAQILELMKQLRQETQTGILLITHDLGVIAEMCDRVVVMYAGRIVEEARVKDLFLQPQHPYTIGLMNSFPRLTERKRYLDAIPGNVPAAGSYQQDACRFADRCSYACQICYNRKPERRQVGADHFVSCHCSVEGKR